MKVSFKWFIIYAVLSAASSLFWITQLGDWYPNAVSQSRRCHLQEAVWSLRMARQNLPASLAGSNTDYWLHEAWRNVTQAGGDTLTRSHIQCTCEEPE